MRLSASVVILALGMVLPAGGAMAAPGDVFKEPSSLPFHAPDFSKIKDSDFEPALEEGMKRQRA